MSTPIAGGRLAAAGSGISRASAQLAQSHVMPSPASSATSVSSSAPATEILIGRGASVFAHDAAVEDLLVIHKHAKDHRGLILAALPLNADLGLEGLELTREIHDDLAAGVMPEAMLRTPCP